MIRHAFTVAALVALAAPALAQLETPERDRTASWYVAHPAAMRAVRAACLNDPGHGMNNPDCINEQQAEFIVASRKANRALDRAPPSDPAYWRSQPADVLRYRVLMCSRIAPQYRADNYCDAAVAAAR